MSAKKQSKPVEEHEFFDHAAKIFSALLSSESALLIRKVAVLLDAVQRMRSSQRDWFGGDKSKEKLSEARKLERAVDKALAEIYDAPKQGDLPW